MGLGASAPHWVFVEAERPEAAPDEREREARRRCLTFYERRGCQRLHADFQAPPLGPGLPIVPYWILVRPLREPDLSPPALRLALSDLYREAYGLGEGHPLVKHCLETFRPGRP